MSDDIINSLNDEHIDIPKLIKQSNFEPNEIDIDSIIDNVQINKQTIVNEIIHQKNQTRDLVMIIDDDPSQLKSIHKLLYEHYDLLLCDKGLVAIELYKKEIKKINSILLDIRLSDISGFEVFDQIKQINYEIPIILITGHQQIYGDGFEIYKKYRPHGYIIKNEENETQMIFDTLISSITLYKNIKLLEKQKVDEINNQTIAGLLHDLRSLFLPITTVPSIIIDSINNNCPKETLYFANMMRNSVDLFSETQQVLFNFAKGNKMKLLLNSYSFNETLTKLIQLSLFNFEDVIEFDTKSIFEGDFIYDKSILMYQVLYNIIKNAYEVCLHRQKKGLITIRVYNYSKYLQNMEHKILINNSQNEDLIIVIGDNGGGISSEFEANFFDAYFTHNKKSGTGLGTWMIKMGVVDLLRGQIILDNNPNIGLSYHISIPHNLKTIISPEEQTL